MHKMQFQRTSQNTYRTLQSINQSINQMQLKAIVAPKHFSSGPRWPSRPQIRWQRLPVLSSIGYWHLSVLRRYVLYTDRPDVCTGQTGENWV